MLVVEVNGGVYLGLDNYPIGMFQDGKCYLAGVVDKSDKRQIAKYSYRMNMFKRIFNAESMDPCEFNDKFAEACGEKRNITTRAIPPRSWRRYSINHIPRVNPNDELADYTVTKW